MDIVRPVLFQPFSAFPLAVQVTPTAIVANQNKSDLIDSFIISLDAGAANNVFMGDSSVTVANGIEIVAGGGPVNFRIVNQNQQYDTQVPLVGIASTMQCQDNLAVPIPFIVWDMSQIFLIAAAITNVRISLFRSQFI
jgi:hypothetical protein